MGADAQARLGRYQQIFAGGRGTADEFLRLTNHGNPVMRAGLAGTRVLVAVQRPARGAADKQLYSRMPVAMIRAHLP